MHKITESSLRRIILEEIAALDLPPVPEDTEIDELEVASKISNKATKLVSAIKSFKEDCPESCMGHIAAELGKLEKTLKNMAKNPGNYSSSPKSVPLSKPELLEPEPSETGEDEDDTAK